MQGLNQRVLTETAKDMRQALPAAANGSVERVLQPYYLALFRRNERVRLHVGLLGRWPTIEEVRPALEAFGVPEGTDPEPMTIRLASQDGRSMPVRTLRFPWTDLDCA
jgi:hypothetical protein